MNTSQSASPNLSSATSTSQPLSTAKIIMSVSTIPAKPLYDIGEQLQIQIKLAQQFTKEKLNYTLLETYNNHDWFKVREWSIKDESTIAYKISKQGICSLQLNVQSPSGLRDAIWIGQYIVGQVKFAENISWEPVKNTYDMGENISFVMQPNINNENYEFQVQINDKGDPNWQVALPWQVGPFINFNFNKSGVIALQLDVRKAGDLSNVQNIWIGQFLINEMNT